MDQVEISEVVKEAVADALKKHFCWMEEDDRVMVRDMVQGGKYVKRSILVMMAGGVMYLMAKLAGFKFGTLFK